MDAVEIVKGIATSDQVSLILKIVLSAIFISISIWWSINKKKIQIKETQNTTQQNQTQDQQQTVQTSQSENTIIKNDSSKLDDFLNS